MELQIEYSYDKTGHISHEHFQTIGYLTVLVCLHRWQDLFSKPKLE